MRRAYRQGVSIYVIGTQDAKEACAVAGISPETHHWKGTEFGQYVKRQGRWRLANTLRLPKHTRTPQLMARGLQSSKWLAPQEKSGLSEPLLKGCP